MIWIVLYLVIAFVLVLPMHFSLTDTIPDRGDRVFFTYILAAAWPLILVVGIGGLIYLALAGKL